jgi:ATP synthase proteolipid subunit
MILLRLASLSYVSSDRSLFNNTVIAVYGLVVSVLIAGSLTPTEPYSLFGGFIHLGAGLACGMTGLAAGYAIGIVGDAVSRSRPKKKLT